ncbi:MAG: flagellar motor protein MotB [Calditrichaeota bacterium]|nr:MAG: flagellar motor protein MotB [Calditrichota bacterium]
MPAENQECDCSGGAPAWMTTFGDMMSLLLTFFILIVSFSSIQEVEFQKAIGSLKGALGVLDYKRSTVSLASLKNIRLDIKNLALVMPELERLKSAIEQAKISKYVDIQPLPDAIKFTLQNQILFDLGKANLKPSIFPVLFEIAKVARKTKGTLRIEGHTDDLPIKTLQFPSNWELSSMRAISVLHYFENLGIPRKKLSCVGYADTRPLVPNTSPQNRAKNRRVEIYLVPGKDSNLLKASLDKLQNMNFVLPDSRKPLKDNRSHSNGQKNQRR